MKHLKQRAELLQSIRAFFQARNVLEVDTPLLCSHSVTDVHINSFAAGERYLQTSPEYAMKRLLAAGSGDIFQLCKSFRPGDVSDKHNPEFTMLEWYRVGFDHHDLMRDMNDFLQHVAEFQPAEKISYRNLFLQQLQIDPLLAEQTELVLAVKQHISLHTDSTQLDKTTCLELLFTHCIEPQLGFAAPVFIYDFPIEQAALAKIRNDNPPVAERFEVYYRGTELANGFHELTDAEEQQVRFEQDQQQRRALNLPMMQIDHYFIDALKQGLPDCAGVALGVDRLLMLMLGVDAIRDVISFDWNRC